MTTAAAYVLFFVGLRRVDASKGSMFFFLKPPLAALIAWLVLRERMTIRMALGGALILAALFLALVPRAAGPLRWLRRRV